MMPGSAHSYLTKRRLSQRCRQAWTPEKRAQHSIKTRQRIAKDRSRRAAEQSASGSPA
jgi:hypothetical protein